MKEIYQIRTAPVCQEEAVIQGEKYRISILTPWLFRLEYSEEGHLRIELPSACRTETSLYRNTRFWRQKTN